MLGCAHRHRWQWCGVFLLAFSPMVGGSRDQTAAAEPSFERDVWPVLEQNCHGCHSATDKKSKGGLSLDAADHLLKGGNTGPLYVPGKPDESLLLKVVSGDKPEMPKKQPPLPPEQVQVLRDWVAAGARIDTWPGEGKLTVVIPAAYRTAPAVTAVALSPDGKLLAAACRSEVVLVAVDDPAAVPRRLATECDLVTCVEFSPDGRTLAAAGGAPARYGEVRFFDPGDGRLIAARRLTRDTLFRGGFAPDGKSIALGGADGAVHVVPVGADPQAPVRSFELHSDWVTDVAFSPDGTMLVTGGRDRATKVASAQSGALLVTADPGREPVTAVASDGQFAVSVNRKGELIGYEYQIALSGVEAGGAGNGAVPVDKRNQYTKPFEGQGDGVADAAASGDRKLLAVAAGTGGEVRVYRIADRQRAATVANVTAPVYALALNADGSRLAVGGKSGVVQVYELPSGKPLKSLTPVPVQAQLPQP